MIDAFSVEQEYKQLNTEKLICCNLCLDLSRSPSHLDAKAKA